MEEFNEISKITDDKPEVKEIIEPPRLIEIIKLKNKVRQYIARFPTELGDYKSKVEILLSNENTSEQEFTQLLDEMKIAIRISNSSNLTKTSYFILVQFVERMSNNLSGLHQTLYNSQDIHKCLDEISLEYEDSLMMPAYVRLPLLTIQIGIGIMNARKVENIIKTELKKKVPDNIASEYNDL